MNTAPVLRKSILNLEWGWGQWKARASPSSACNKVTVIARKPFLQPSCCTGFKSFFFALVLPPKKKLGLQQRFWCYLTAD